MVCPSIIHPPLTLRTNACVRHCNQIFNSLLVLVALGLVACTPPKERPTETKVSAEKYYTAEDFKSVPKIDIHTHIRSELPVFVDLARENNFKLNSIVVDVPTFASIEEQATILKQQQKDNPDIVRFTTSFTLEGWDDEGWSDKVIAKLQKDFDEGALGVKVWKNIGMIDRDKNGELITLDNPKFDPIFRFIKDQDKILLSHAGEPKSCWLPLDSMTLINDRNYFEGHPEYHMYLHPELPAYEAHIDARNKMLDKNPDIRFVGVHMASLEWSVDEIAKFLDKYPNVSVDMAERVRHLQYQAQHDYDRVREFFVKYQDRILYATDIIQNPDPGDTTRLIDYVTNLWRMDWQFFNTTEMVTVPQLGKVKGLGLPKSIVDKIYYSNANRVFDNAWKAKTEPAPVSRQYFPPSGQTPDPLLFTHPQYNTWIELQYDQNEEDILKYAQSILDNGFPPGVLMIDDNWQIDYGVWDFSAERFENPKLMTDKLHDMGFKVMLWACPFVSPDSEVYRELESRQLLVFEDAKKTLPAIVRWWNGASAIIDLTNPEGEQWYIDQLLNLQKKYGVDGFKLDAGDPEFYSNIFSFKNILSNEHTEKHASIGLKFPLNEFRASWKMAGQPLAQRLRDKDHTWKHLGTLIPGILAQGLDGYAFTCPDMIGGGEMESFNDDSILDEELIVRSAQCHALMPMMQFSVAPWRVLNQTNLEICKKMAELHHQFGKEILEIAKASAKTGEPIVRNMEYMFPHKGYEEIKDQFMLGDYILVAPVIEKGKTSRFVEFPEGTWQGDDGSNVKGPVRLQIDVPMSRLAWYRKVDH